MAEHHTHDADYTAPAVNPDLGPLRRIAALAAVVGLAAWAGLGLANYATYGASEHGGVRDFFLTYLAAFAFWVCVPVGSMSLLFLAFLTSASWGLVLRRCFQAATRTLFPVVFLLFIPVVVSLFLNEESPYWWVVDAKDVPEWQGNDPVIKEQGHRQKLFLNLPVFLIATLGILAVYSLLSRALSTWLVRAEDDGDKDGRSNVIGLAGPAVLIWALTWTVFVSFVVMSVEVSWASTMFPVIAAMNSFLMAITFATVVFYTLIGGNATALSIVKDKFRIDIGSLTYGFTMIWCYATFCQYMLIWAGNLPEEIGYVRKRTFGGWGIMAILLAVVHWLLPFVILLFRGVKTDPVKMRRVAVMLLFICAVDVTWWVVPAYEHAHQWLHVPMAAAAIVGVGGVWGLAFLRELGKRSLLPKKDTAFLATWGHH